MRGGDGMKGLAAITSGAASRAVDRADGSHTFASGFKWAAGADISRGGGGTHRNCYTCSSVTLATGAFNQPVTHPPPSLASFS